MTEDTKNREIVTSREFDAPRELVFDAFTDKQHVEGWWLPKGGTTLDWDSQPGGVWRYQAPTYGNNQMIFRITFVEVDKPNKIVYDYSPDVPSEDNTVRTHVTFEETGEKTRVTLQLVFASAKAREQAVKYGAIVGAMQALEGLAEYVESL